MTYWWAIGIGGNLPHLTLQFLLPYHLPSYLRLVLTQVQPPDQPRNASTELTNDVKCAELGWSCVPLAVRPMEPGVMRHNAPFLTWLLFSLWDLLGPRVRYYLTFMAILTSNLCVPLQELC